MIRVSRFAAEEARAAARWYDKESLGLGHSFLEAFQESLREIEKHPEFFGELETLPNKGYRRFRLSRFPYLVIYRIGLDGDVVVVAVAHTSRRPNYWRRRDRDK